MPSSFQTDRAERTPRNNSHVPSACTSCRDKKTKCDGGQPCARCSRSGKLCTYTIDQDRRTARGRECKLCTHYRTYLSQLEAEIAALKARPPAAEAQDTPASERVDSSDSQTDSPPASCEEPLFDAGHAQPEATGLFNFTLPAVATTGANVQDVLYAPSLANDAQFLDWMGYAQNLGYSEPCQPSSLQSTEPQSTFAYLDLLLLGGNAAEGQ